MPTYDAQTTRNDAAALIPEQVTGAILSAVPSESVVMRLGRKLPNMSVKQSRMPVISGLIEAYFVTGDTGLKQTSSLAWQNKYIVAEEMAVIVPIPEAVIDDSGYPIWDEVQPQIISAFARKFDKAVLFGTDAPATWPSAIVTQAIAAGNTVTLGAGANIYQDIMGEGGVIAKVEEDGYLVTGHVGALTMRAKLRGVTDANGNPLFVRNPGDGASYRLDGEDMYTPRTGVWDATSALLCSGDWDQLVFSIRQDITFKYLDQAVISDAAGNIVLNLAQQDMVGLRCVMRLGWQLPNPINPENETEGGVLDGVDTPGRFPFAVLEPAA